jgi:hypothetical protein
MKTPRAIGKTNYSDLSLDSRAHLVHDTIQEIRLGKGYEGAFKPEEMGYHSAPNWKYLSKDLKARLVERIGGGRVWQALTNKERDDARDVYVMRLRLQAQEQLEGVADAHNSLFQD